MHNLNLLLFVQTESYLHCCNIQMDNVTARIVSRNNKETKKCEQQYLYCKVAIKHTENYKINFN